MASLNEFLKFDGTLSILEIAESKAAFEDRLKNLDVALNVAKRQGMSPEAFTVFIRQSLTADQTMLDMLFRKYAEDYDTLLKELEDFLSKKHGVKTLQEFLEGVYEVNAYTNNAYEFFSNYLESKIELLDSLEDYTLQLRKLERFQFVSDQFEHLEDVMIGKKGKLLGKGEDLDIRGEFGNFFYDLKEELQKQLHAIRKTYENPRYVTEAWDPKALLLNVLNDYRVHFQDLIESYNLKVGSVPEGIFYNATLNKIEALVESLLDDLAKQIDRVINKVEIDYDLELLHLDYNKIAPLNQLATILVDGRKQLDDLGKKVGIPKLKKQKIYGAIEEALNKNIGLQGRLFDAISQAHLIQGMHDIKAKAVAPQKVAPIRDEIYKFFTTEFQQTYEDISKSSKTIKSVTAEIESLRRIESKATGTVHSISPADWWEARLKQLPRDTQIKVSPRQFEEAVYRFLSSPVDQPSIFAQDWDTLQAIVGYMVREIPELKELDDILHTINPYEIMPAQILAQAKGTWYTFKLEQLYTSMSLLSIESFNKLISEIVSESGRGKFLQTLAESGTNIPGATAAQEVIRLVKPYQTYFEFVTNVMQLNLEDNVRFAFLSTLQNYARKNPILFMEEFDYHFQQIMQQTADMINTTENMYESFALQNLLESRNLKAKVDSKFADKTIWGKTIEHTSPYDTEGLVQLIKTDLAEEFQDPTKFYVVWDIETSGQNKHANAIVDLTLRPLDADAHPAQTFWTQLDPAEYSHQPQDQMLQAIYDASLDTEQARMAAWWSRCPAGQGVSEAEVLRKALDQLKAYEQATGKEIVLVGHNTTVFDFPHMEARLQAHGILDEQMQDFIKYRDNSIDTLELYRQKAGYAVISSADQIKLKSTLHYYGSKMMELGHSKLIDPSNGQLAEALKNLAKELRADLHVTGDTQGTMNIFLLIEDLEAASHEIFAQLGTISDRNALTRWQYLSKEWVDSPDGQSFFVEFMYNEYQRLARELKALVAADRLDEANELLQTKLLDPKVSPIAIDALQDSEAPWEIIQAITREDIVQKVGSYLNTSKLLYHFTEGVNYLGIKQAVVWDVMHEFFDIPLIEGKISSSLAEHLTQVGKRIQRLAQVKNPKKLAPFAKDIKHALGVLVAPTQIRDVGQLFNMPVNLSQLPGAIKYLRTDKLDVVSNWAMLLYVYDQYVSKKLLTPALLNQIDPELLELLEKTRRASVYHAIVPGTDMTFFEKQGSLALDEYYGSPKKRRAAIADFQNTAEYSGKLDEILDKHGLARSDKQGYSTALEETQQMLDVHSRKMNYATSHVQRKYIQDQRNYNSFLGKEALRGMLQLDISSPENLTKSIIRLRDDLAYYNTWVEFDIADVDTYFQAFLENKAEIEAAGLVVYNEGTRYYVKPSKTLNREVIYEQGQLRVFLDQEEIFPSVKTEIDLDAADKLIDADMAKELKKVRRSMHRLSGNRSVGSTGEIVNAEFYERLYAGLPQKLKDMTLPIEDTIDDRLFHEPRYNFTNLGSISSRRARDEFTATTVVATYANSMERTVRQADKKLLYTQMYYDKSFSINVGWLSTVPDVELLKYFQQNPAYVLTALVEDPKLGRKVIRIAVNDIEDIATARRLNAVIMPAHTYSKVFETINTRKFDSKFLNLWQKIMYTYKVGFLLDPGVWLRNWIDSTIKTYVDSDGDIKAVARAKLFAADLLRKYDDITDEIIQMDTLYGGKFLRKNYEDYFAKKLLGEPPLPKETWDFVHGFIMENASAGLTQSWVNYYQKMGNHTDDAADFWQSFVHYSRKVMHPNSQIEQLERLAQYILLTERGLTTTEAFYRISKTHFDYAMKTDFERHMELVVPFYTYTMRNLENWINAVNNRPWIASLFRDVEMPASGITRVETDDLERNLSLQYHILSGNIPLNDSGLVLKTSASFMDAFRLIGDPIGSIKERLAPPLQLVVDTTLQIQQNNVHRSIQNALGSYGYGGMFDQPVDSLIGYTPIIGPTYQRYVQSGPKHAERTGSVLPRVLPGVFGSVKATSPRNNYNFSQPTLYIPKAYNHRTWWARKYYYQKPQHWVKADSFYKKHYTPTGVSRMKLRMSPVTSANLKFRLKDMWGHIR